MDPATILADAEIILRVGALAASLAMDVAPFFQSLYQLIVSKIPLSDTQRAALLEQEAALTDQLNAPSIPADQA